MCFQIITVFLIIVATSSFLFYLLKNKKIVVRSGSKMFAFERNLRDDERLVKRKTRPTPGTKHPKRGKWKKAKSTKSSTKQKYVTKQKKLMVSIFDYLLEGFKNFLNYAYARSTKKEMVIPTIQFIAMDCEMVGCGKNGSKSLLARCSLVALSETEPMNLLDHDTDETPRLQIEVLYDVYVKPTKNVTDYRTQYSGITAEHLWRDDAVSWDVCHSHVKKVLKSTEDKRVVLIGHGLENDFQVLKYWHPRRFVRDTATFHPMMRQGHRRMLPRKLSYLAEEHLGMNIQSNKDISQYIDIYYGDYASKYGEHSEGHSSIEDAAAALLLYHKFSQQWEDALGNPLVEIRQGGNQ